LVGQLYNGRIVMFKHCFGGLQLLFFGRTAVEWADGYIQTAFCGDQLHFYWSVDHPMGELGCSDSIL
jgi:hypothetical protein